MGSQKIKRSKSAHFTNAGRKKSHGPCCRVTANG